MGNKKQKAFRRGHENAVQVEYNLTDHYSRLEFTDTLEQVIQLSPMHKRVLDTLQNESDVYTLKGRINKSRVCAVCDIRPKDLNQVLQDCRKLFGTPAV